MASYRVALIEDEPLGIGPVRQSVARLSYTLVEVFRSTDDALAGIGRLQPDVVIMDIKMRESSGDGIAAAGVIRKLYNIPIVFLTAFPDEEERSKDAGAFGYMTKPLTEPNHLKMAIESAVYSHDATEQTARTLRFALDCESRFLSINALSEKVLGYAPKELRGKQIDEYVVAAQRTKTQQIRDQVVLKHEPSTEVMNFNTRHGAIVELGVHSEPVFWDNRVIGVFCTAHNLFDWRQIDWVDKNIRRRDLIKKKIATTASEEELGELQYLQNEAERHLATMESFDPEQVNKLRELAKTLGVTT